MYQLNTLIKTMNKSLLNYEIQLTNKSPNLIVK
jgi:hypothetical protein